MIRNILISCDILLCQEIILLKDDINFLHFIDENFNVYALPSKQSDSVSFDGRPVGGMVIFYRKSINLKADEICVNEHFVLLKISLGSFSFCLENIYLPCDKRTLDSLNEYQFVLGELQAWIDSVQNSHLLCV